MKSFFSLFLLFTCVREQLHVNECCCPVASKDDEGSLWGKLCCHVWQRTAAAWNTLLVALPRQQKQ